MKAQAYDHVVHVVLRAERGDLLPDALFDAVRPVLEALRAAQGPAEARASAVIHASGILEDTEVAIVSASGEHELRAVPGASNAVALEAVLDGALDAAATPALRVLLLHETQSGLQALGGELRAALVRSLDGTARVFTTAGPRVHDERAEPTATRDAAFAPKTGSAGLAGQGAPGAPASWSDVVAASDARPAPKPVPASASAPLALPTRPARKASDDDDTPSPEPGDLVDHFAFGRCEVLKSDGERLHLRVHKDQRIREIALEMLRVSRLPDEGGVRRFRLDRKLG